MTNHSHIRLNCLKSSRPIMRLQNKSGLAGFIKDSASVGKEVN